MFDTEYYSTCIVYIRKALCAPDLSNKKRNEQKCETGLLSSSETFEGERGFWSMHAPSEGESARCAYSLCRGDGKGKMVRSWTIE
jgi:hypothetical protein